MKTLFDEIKEMETARKYMMEADCPITTPLTDGEHSLGKLPPEIRPLWKLKNELCEMIIKQEAVIRIWVMLHPSFSPSNHDNHELLDQWQKLDTEHEELYNKSLIAYFLFQGSLKKAIPASRGFKHIVYRADWELVGIHKTQNEQAQDDMWNGFLKGFNIKLN